MKKYFILDENKQPIEISERIYYAHMASRTITDTWFDTYVVGFDVFDLLYDQIGTSFIGVQEGGPPYNFFSTVVTQKGESWVRGRYSTWRQAQLGHLRAVEKYMKRYLI